jgi:hypothetical protein
MKKRLFPKRLFPGETKRLTDKQRRARFNDIFIALFSGTPGDPPVGSDAGFLCSDCMPLETDISSTDVEVWRECSHGWTGPVICSECHLSIPVYVDAHEDRKPPPGGRPLCRFCQQPAGTSADCGNCQYVARQAGLPPPNGNVIHGTFDHIGATEAFNRASELDSDPKTYEAAEELYRKALRLDPSFSEAIINLGNLRHRRRDSFEAIECYQAAIKINSRQVEPFYNIGCIYAESGTPARAIPYYKTALVACGLVEHDKELRADVHYMLAISLDETGDVSAAREHWQHYIDLLPRGEWAEMARQWLINTASLVERKSKPQLVAIRGGKA